MISLCYSFEWVHIDLITSTGYSVHNSTPLCHRTVFEACLDHYSAFCPGALENVRGDRRMWYTKQMLYSALLLKVGCLLQAAQYTKVKWVLNPGIEKVETCRYQIKPCIVGIAMQNLSSQLASKNFMRAAD